MTRVKTLLVMMLATQPPETDLDSRQHDGGVGVLQAGRDALDDRLGVFGALRLEARQRVQDEHLRVCRQEPDADGGVI